MEVREGRMTPLGTLVTEVSDGHVTVTLRASDGVTLMSDVASDGRTVTLEVWAGERIPRPGDELTVNGSTVEVVKVEVGDGVRVLGDNGLWVSL